MNPDGLLLAIDTSTRTAGVALARAGALVAEYTWLAGMDHTRGLMPVIRAVLHENGAAVQSLDGIAIATGPGSFNGLRVGMATAKGLAYGLGVPLTAASTLEVEAYQHAASPYPICAVHDAGRGEVAWAVFRSDRRGGWQRLVEEHVTDLETLVRALRSRTLVCGEPPPTYLEALVERRGALVVVPGPAARVRRAGCLAELGWRRLLDGGAVDMTTLQPLYLRRPAITQRRASAIPRL